MFIAKQQELENLKSQPDIKLVDIEPISEKVKIFPTTRYYGSKRKLLLWIFEHVKALNFYTVLDGFGGTGSVSLLFKAMGKSVTYHDAFVFNKHVAETVLSHKISVSEERFVDFVSEVSLKRGLIYKNFRGLYYKDLENCWLDGFLEKMSHSELLDKEKSLFMYALFQACLMKRPFNLFHRANLNLRLNSGVKRKFGNFSTWEKPFHELMIKSYSEVAASVWKGKGDIQILDPTSIDNLDSGYDLVYLDPPYINLHEKNNKDDFWKRYHFLEGLSRYDVWGKNIDYSSPLKDIPAPEEFVKWSRKSTFKDKLYELIEKHRNSIVVLSYVSDSYPDEVDISKFFEGLFSEVSVHSKEYKHALSKNKKRELLFIGRP